MLGGDRAKIMSRCLNSIEIIKDDQDNFELIAGIISLFLYDNIT